MLFQWFAKILPKHFEKVLLVLLLVSVFMMLISQIGLYYPTTRVFFTGIATYEGVNISQMAVNKSASVTLQLLDSEADKNIKVLLNGDVVADFTEQTVKVQLTHPMLLEIDGTKAKQAFVVKVVGADDTIVPNVIDKTVVVKNAIAVIGRIGPK
ncbi:MAG: hypothetical protein H7Y41_04840 [Hyphomonadaceae bacterium]|nr:hypothetical protein [Clostridia bacterium]